MSMMHTTSTSPVPAIEAEANREAIRNVLKQCRLFRGVGEADLDATVGCMQLCGGREGTVLAAQDRPGDGLYIVYSGRVKVVMYGANGREVTLAILRPGEVFGELSMLDGAPRSATVVAMTDARLLALPREDFMRHLQRHPQIALNLLGELARRLRRADETIVGLALQDVEVRLVRTLARLAHEEGGVQGQEGLVLRRRPTQQELANMVGSSRETVSRTLAAMARQGLAVPRGRSLVLTEQLLRRGMVPAQA
jgi:CRP-like cAMP-binding protein